MDSKTLRACIGCSASLARSWAPILSSIFSDFGIDTSEKQAIFLANVGYETKDFSELEFPLSLSESDILKIFPRYFDKKSAKKYVKNPKALANHVFWGRLGNGPEGGDDGWKYRPRGLLRVVGKTEYTRCGEILGVDLVSYPDKLGEPMFAALSAGWVWRSRKLNRLAAFGDFTDVVKALDPHMSGMPERRVRWERAKKALTEKK